MGHAQLQTTQPGCIRCTVSSSSVLLVAHYGLSGQFYQSVRCESPWDDGWFDFMKYASNQTCLADFSQHVSPPRLCLRTTCRRLRFSVAQQHITYLHKEPDWSIYRNDRGGVREPEGVCFLLRPRGAGEMGLPPVITKETILKFVWD